MSDIDMADEFAAASEAIGWALHPDRNYVTYKAFQAAVDRFPAERLHLLASAATRLSEAAVWRARSLAVPLTRPNQCVRCRLAHWISTGREGHGEWMVTGVTPDCGHVTADGRT